MADVIHIFLSSSQLKFNNIQTKIWIAILAQINLEYFLLQACTKHGIQAANVMTYKKYELVLGLSRSSYKYEIRASQCRTDFITISLRIEF